VLKAAATLLVALVADDVPFTVKFPLVVVALPVEN
jgi:hypothetical protein